MYLSQSGSWTFKIKVPAGLVSPEASLLGLQMAGFSLCPHMVFPLCLHPWCLCECKFLLLIRTLIRLDKGLIHHLFKDSVSRYSHILKYWGLGFNI